MSEKIEITYQEQTIRYVEHSDTWEWLEQEKTSDRLSTLKDTIDSWIKAQSAFKRFNVIFRASIYEPFQKGVATSKGTGRYGSDFFYVTNEKTLKRIRVSADSVWLDSPENMQTCEELKAVSEEIETLREKRDVIQAKLVTAKAYLEEISSAERKAL